MELQRRFRIYDNRQRTEGEVELGPTYVTSDRKDFIRDIIVSMCEDFRE